MPTSFLLKKDTFKCFTLLILLVVLQVSSLFGQCPEGSSLTLTTQEGVDLFAVNYPNCKELRGDLRINGIIGITNLDGLQNLRSIDGRLIIKFVVYSIAGLKNLESVGSLHIEKGPLFNLSGLENLKSVGYLNIENNDAMTSLSGLENLDSISHLSICGNANLVDLSALNQIRSLGSVRVENNYALTSLSGLENIDSISSLEISENPNLVDLSGLKNIHSLETLSIKNNDALTSLSGLGNIDSISRSFSISDNDALTNLTGLSNLHSIGNYLTISENDALINLAGLENLNSIGGLVISFNNALINLEGLNELNAIAGSLDILRNPLLINLDGLDRLNSIGQRINIYSNPMLSDLSALRKLTELGDLFLNIDGGWNSNDSLYPAINDNLIEHLSELENIKIVSGTLDISNTNLQEVPFLKNIVSVGKLNITENDSLVDLSGLSNLTSTSSICIIRNPLLSDLSFLHDIDTLNDLGIAGNESLNSLSGLENLDTIRGLLSIQGNNELINFGGLESLVSVSNILVTGNNKLTNFKGLENLVSTGNLIARINSSLINFEGLNKLQSIGGSFLVVENHAQIDFTGLESLTSVGGSFGIGGGIDPSQFHYYYNPNPYNLEGNNSLVSFKGLERLSSIGGYFQIAHLDALTSLTGLENLKSVGSGYSNLRLPTVLGLLISDNLLLTNLSGLDTLTTVKGPVSISANISLSNLSGLENLDSIGGALSISSNNALSDISALDNLTPYHSKLNIHNNASLSSCNIRSVCNYLSNSENPFYIENNYSGCNNETEILQNCGRAKIQSHFFYDLNQNKMFDSNEPYASFGSVILNPDNIRIIQNPKTGYGIWYVDPGNYTLSVDEASISNSTLTTDSTNYDLNLVQGDCKVLNFGVYPNQPVSEMRSFMFSPNARCNESSPFTIHTKNWGTTNTKGILWFKADTVITALSFFDEPDTTIQPNKYGWFFDNLMPSEYITKHVDAGIPGIGQVEVGQNLSFESFAEFTDDNGQQLSTSVFNYQTPVRCSYDPNDKLVNPNRLCNHILMDENITYTIRFQNTGNDVAYKVSITDEIDNNLDLTTFSLINSSHIDSLQTSITDDGTVTFDFNNINLPDSTSNLEGSQGYVSYTIKSKEGLPENTIIKNTSAIYFDYNPAIITNTVENILVSELPNINWCRDFNENGLGNPNENIESCERPEGYVMDCSDLNDLVSIEEGRIRNFINIYPNPSDGIFKIDIGNSSFRKVIFSLFNAQGEQLIEPANLNNQQQLEYPNLANGIYYLKIRLDDLTLRKKLIVMK